MRASMRCSQLYGHRHQTIILPYRSCKARPTSSCTRGKHTPALRQFVSVWCLEGKEGILCAGRDCLQEEDGSVMVRDDLDALLMVLPQDIREPLVNHTNRASLLEVVLDLGRRPEARFLGVAGGEFLRAGETTWTDLEAAEAAVGQFGGDNRAGVQGTLHRISAIRNRKGTIIGLTCRVGRAVTGHIDMIRDILDTQQSVLFLGRPGVGKTTVIREMARVLADDLAKRVVIVDTSNEIGGDGDVPHPAIGGARRMQVPDPSQQHKVMVEAVENHMPEVVIVDEIGTEAEALACRSIAERGVQLIGTAHGQLLENLLKNPTLADLVGGISHVTLGDDEARSRGTQKTVQERTAPPTFPLVVEMRERALWVVHYVCESVDALLLGATPLVQVRRRDPDSRAVVVDERPYSTDPGAGDGPGPLDSDDGSDGDPPSLRNGEEHPYAWVQRLREVPDKDALAEMAHMGYMAGERRGERFWNGAGTNSRRSRKKMRAHSRGSALAALDTTLQNGRASGL